jgi:hypothetical protein
VTPTERSDRGEGRSPVHPFDPAVIGLVIIQSSILPTALWWLVSHSVFAADPRRKMLRDHEGGLEHRRDGVVCWPPHLTMSATRCCRPATAFVMVFNAVSAGFDQPRCALLPLSIQAPLRSARFSLTMTMLPARHSLRDGPQCSVSGLCRHQVRAPAALHSGSAEICPLQPDNDDAAGLL